MNLHAVPAFRAQLALAARNRYARQLADALVVSLLVPEGHGLVAHLTDDCVRDNREAVFRWVVAELRDASLSSLSPSQLLPILKYRLKDRLEAIWLE